jgi:hypothetical protein
MASERMLEALNGAWQIAEAKSRKYAPGSFSPLPLTPEAEEQLNRIREVQRYAMYYTDKQVAKQYPDIVESCVSPSMWARNKPLGQP